MAEATICIFAKPPVAKIAKTRLASAIGARHAAELAEAFLLDTLDSLGQLSWADVVIAATEPFGSTYISENRIWIQPEGTLDERIEAILQRALQLTPLAFAVGADSPGLPLGYIEEAMTLLASHDAVLGPSRDGGFYLFGVKDFPAGLLQGIEWSQPTTLEQTIPRLQQRCLSIALLPEWFDVDTVGDLSYLETLLAQRVIHCPHTQTVLEELRGSWVTAVTDK